MRISRREAVSVFSLWGVWTSPGWSPEKLAFKLNDPRGLERYFESPEPYPDGPALALALALVAARARGEDVEVYDDGEKWAPRPSPGARQSRLGRPGLSRPYAERVADWAARPVRLSKRHSIVQVVIRELRRATEASPVTRDELLGVLRHEFPERDPRGMASNLHNLVPVRLREHYGLVVRRVLRPGLPVAYWLPPGPEIMSGCPQSPEDAQCPAPSDP